MTDEHVDVLVIGAGVGGLCAAARLAHAGTGVLLVERSERVGGRASTVEIEGFQINTGAVAIEVGGPMEQTFLDVGAELNLRFPDPANVFRLKGRTVNPTRGGWAMILDQVTKKGAKLLGQLGAAREGELPEQELTLDEWLRRATSNQTVHRLFRNLSAAIFAVNSDEIPARAFLTYFMQKGAFKRFGFHPEGTIGVCRPLAEVVRRDGGEVWCDSEVSALACENGRVTGATITRAGGETMEVSVGAVVSNVGPVATIGLCGEEALGAEYVQGIRARSRPTANIIIHVASREPLIDAPGLMVFSATERICNMGTLTHTCPELAPEGWHLSVIYAVPRPAVGDFDAAAELEASLAELHQELPGMADARVIDARVMRGEWPAQRALAGYELPRETPLDNLWHVGDAVREYGDGGTQACAVSAQIVADALLARAGV
ncbi:MAG TPA: NAD(P)/FAD-dependent oxidoreductase [Solirubrobacteraceae bacterium]|jgi:phytoene dehydrogenase-like protein|nr:NAD(P)/FAD-dependent oxidoreductase [Solirubrobacteraceae bacterium]